MPTYDTFGRELLKPPEIDRTRSNDLDYVQKVNFEVAQHLFPHRTTQSMLLKMYGEISEIVAKPYDSMECVDAIIMLLDQIHQNGDHAGVMILGKLQINLGRKWREDPQTGVFQHV